ncbi:MAG: RNA ligase [Gammaproteobacteria bacterium]|nr:MAG: RNA ligase [Gammaproteobacteria bacterium]
MKGTAFETAFKEALERGKAKEERIGNIPYVRFANDFHGIPLGTVVLGETVVFGYPHIGRILRLERGLSEHFEAPFFAEEKVDGYNVRVFWHQGEALALTRRGFLCQFTIDRLPDLLPLDIFREHPETVVCAEVAGPDNPYLEEHPPYVTEDVRLFAFDLARKGEQGFLPYREKIALLDAYAIPSAARFGRFSLQDVDALKALMAKLDAEGKEGVVLKEDSPRDRRAKYVTESSSLEDIRTGARSLLQLPSEYYTQRLLRLALFLDEERIRPSRELYERLGEGLIDGILTMIEQYKREHKVYHTFRCRFRHEERARLFVESLKSLMGHAHLHVRRLEREGDFYLLEFDKILPRATGFLGHLLSGGMVFD